MGFSVAARASVFGSFAVSCSWLVGVQAAAAQVLPQIPGQTRQDVDPASRTQPVQPRLVDPAAPVRTSSCPFTGTGKVTLTAIDVTGATLVATNVIQSAVADLVNVPSDLQVLCVARDRVAKLYADRGEPLVRVDFPEQRLTGGKLTLAVTEGAIARASLLKADELGPAAQSARHYLGALADGSATSWANVERAFLLTREIPGAEVGFSIRNAGTASNALEAVAAFGRRRRVDIGVNSHNFGAHAYGRDGGSIRLDFNSFTPLAERTTLIGSSSRTGDQQVIQLLEEFRVGASGLTVLGDVAYGETEPGGELKVLALQGHSLVGRLGMRYPLVRRRNASVDIGARFEAINQKNTVGFLEAIGGSVFTLSREKLRVGAVEATARLTPASISGLSFGGTVEFRQGIEGFGASDEGDPLLTRGDADPGFTALRANSFFRYGFATKSGIAPWVSIALSGQWSAQGLPAYEEYQIGNYTVGRGYEPGAASGDRGLGAQFEAGADVLWTEAGPVLGGQALFGLFAFADVARVWNEDPLSYDKSIASLGGGLRLRTSSTQVSLFYAKPRKAPIPFAETPNGRIFLTFSRNFSIR